MMGEIESWEVIPVDALGNFQSLGIHGPSLGEMFPAT
jgi:hypothetical protein